MNQWIKTLIISGLLAIIFGCDKSPNLTRQVIRPVSYAQAQTWDGRNFEIFSGQTRSSVDSALSFKIPGTIQQRPVHLGSHVQQGQLIAQLDTHDYSIAVNEANANLSAAIANNRNAQAEYIRVSELYEGRSSSKAQLDAARAMAQSTKSAVKVTRERLANARLQYSYTTLNAPEHCVIAKTFADVNENVSPGQPIVQINCGQCSEVEVSVPGRFIDAIKPGMPVDVSIDAIPDRVFVASVIQVGFASGGGAFQVKTQMSGECPHIRSGLSANARFTFNQQQSMNNAVVVPFVAVGEDNKGRYVFVLEKSTDKLWKAKRRSVQISDPVPEGMVIEEGLKPGERVATAG
ncbi:MAG: efflux RND transporter periplasmic adaptor subunit, partial [Gammaproteobacteria bacterium]|nr:efflux RND transporter periplasmic adaptor subunit [Gammaproteobacteria bacterium]